MKMKNIEGQRIPDVTFHTREDGQWKDVTTAEVFAKKKVVVFALPGAFTPTCSSSHVPRYQELAHAFKERGIDDIVCISVNDAYVMQEWAKHQHADDITFLPDGNAELTEKLGMLVDKTHLGYGKRSWRYSMLVNDGLIEKMFIEDPKDGDPFDVSDADTMLKHIDPKAKAPHDVLLFTKPGCSFCTKAKKMLGDRGWAYDEVPSTPRKLRAVSGSGKASTPQVFIDGKYIGDSEALEKFLASQ
jgi:glutathione-dependent peroxiredoxin